MAPRWDPWLLLEWQQVGLRQREVPRTPMVCRGVPKTLLLRMETLALVEIGYSGNVLSPPDEFEEGKKNYKKGSISS